MTAILDPEELRFDSSRHEVAIARLSAMDAKMASKVVESVGSSQSLADLMEHYDFGEPGWNGSLIVLASTLLAQAPTNVVIETWEDLALIDEDYGRRFHHGNVTVEGSFAASESIWITGDLHVHGALRAGWLDAFPDLLVAGDLKAAAMTFSGLTFVGGELSADRFVMMEAQGETILRGVLKTPLLLDDGASEDEFSQVDVGRFLDIDKESFEVLSAALGVSIRPEDKYAFELVQRALEVLDPRD